MYGRLTVFLLYNYRIAADSGWDLIVYTCQKPQPTRCGFFLWHDEAQSRATMVVLSNSRSESRTTPQTPPTPSTPTMPREERLLSTIPAKVLQMQTTPPVSPGQGTSYGPSKTTGISQDLAKSTLSNYSLDQLSDDEDEEFHDWPASEDEELTRVAERIMYNSMPPPETPRKAVKPDPFSTPGKRRYDEMSKEEAKPWLTPSTSNKEDDIFTTPSKSPSGTNLFAQYGLPSPLSTPTSHRFKDVTGQEPELTKEILQALQSHQVVLSPEIQNTIKSIGSKHSLFTHGIIKGRDVSRSLLLKKNEDIAKLQGEIASLQAGMENNRATIRHLRETITMSKYRERKEDQ